MYNDILSALACLFNLYGTIFAVLCIIKMSFKDVMRTNTVEYLIHSDETVLEQRYNARTGIGIIFIGAILQLVCIFYKNISLWGCGVLSGIAIFGAIVIIVVERYRMKKYKTEVSKERE